MNRGNLRPAARRTQVKERHAQTLSHLWRRPRVARHSLRSSGTKFRKGHNQQSRGKSKTTDVIAGNAATKRKPHWRQEKTRWNDGLNDSAVRLAKWLSGGRGVSLPGTLSRVESGRRVDLRFPVDFATASRATTEVGGRVAAGSAANTEADRLPNSTSR